MGVGTYGAVSDPNPEWRSSVTIGDEPVADGHGART